MSAMIFRRVYELANDVQRHAIAAFFAWQENDDQQMTDELDSAELAARTLAETIERRPIIYTPADDPANL